MLIPAGLVAAVVATSASTANAAGTANGPGRGAAARRLHHHRRPHHGRGVTVTSATVKGHRVRIVRWRKDMGVSATVGYSRHRFHTTPGWAGASGRHPDAVAAMNGGTWNFRTGRPSGTVWSNGRRFSRLSHRPAAGFLDSGGVVFGARNAARRGAGNVLAGLAYLVRHGRPIRSHKDAPYTHLAQWACGPRGSDGRIGCFRSNVVRFADGSFGLVEVAYASMPLTARILHRLGVTDAVTYDSGGSATLWTRHGHGGCASRHMRGRCVGIAESVRRGPDREIPDAIILHG
jgi:Phosphodiester glycosidase